MALQRLPTVIPILSTEDYVLLNGIASVLQCSCVLPDVFIFLRDLMSTTEFSVVQPKDKQNRNPLPLPKSFPLQPEIHDHRDA